MSGVLGPGCRVWIGWTPTTNVYGPVDARLRTGTVVDGPHPPGTLMLFSGRTNRSVMWIVQADGAPQPTAVNERLLTPLDGGEPERVETEDEAVV